MPNPDAGTERATPTSATTAPPASDRIPGPWSRIPRWTPDVVVAVAATLYTLPLLPEHAESGPRLAALVILALAIAASLPWRRARPLPVLAIMLVAAAGHLVLGAPLVAADVLLLVAVYTVSSRHDRTRSLPAAALVIVWLLGATMTDLGTDYLNVGEVASLILLVILVWTWGAFVRIRRAHIAALEDRAQRLEHERDTRERLAAAAERARLAREIHDVVSHGLGVVVVMSEGAAATVDTDADRAREAMLDVRDTGRSALTEMRRMLGVLHEGEPGSSVSAPGVSKLSDLVDESRAAGLPVTLTSGGEPVSLSPETDLTVYRIVQEALTNVHRHAGPVTHVDVELSYEPAGVSVRVADDGSGPRTPGRGDRADLRGNDGRSTADVEVGVGTDGHGLRGMRERVHALGGRIRFTSRTGGGVEVAATLPITPTAPSPSGVPPAEEEKTR